MAVSRGGLVVPSEHFMNEVYKMEVLFESIHQKSVLLELNVIRKFQTILIGKFPDLPEALLKKFARTRTFLCIRALNAKLKDIDMKKAGSKGKRKLLNLRINVYLLLVNCY